MEYVALLGLGVAFGVCLAWFMSDWARIRAMRKGFFEEDLESLGREVDEFSVELSQVWSKVWAMEKRVKKLEEE